MVSKAVVTILASMLALITLFGGACQQHELSTQVAQAETKPTPEPRMAPAIEIAAVGDIMMGSTSINDSFLPPNDGRNMLKEVTPILTAADIAFGNLEGPMLEGGKTEKCADSSPAKKTNDAYAAPIPTPVPGKTPPKKPAPCFAFRVPTRYGQYLKDAGFDILNLANNHAGDFGEQGRASTRKVLDGLGIKYAGGDKDRFSTAYLDVKGVSIAVVGFDHNPVSPNVNDLDEARRLVTAAKKKAQIVIVSFHGGAEGEGAQHVLRQTEMLGSEKRGNLPLFAHTVIDAGADLVLGHGPHVLRGMEFYKGHLIVYSMGNFATYGMFNLKGVQGITAIFDIKLTASGDFASARIIPVRQEGRGGPVLDNTGAAIRKLRELSTADFGASAPRIEDDGTVASR
ncbi:MAG TPA: CapA family protein [Pyrinomonadaceae bacterium]|nr:CapA family protein [Pyrinomonadaceae bacterium]